MIAASEVKKAACLLSDRYFKLLLLVGKSGCGKTSLINEICGDNAYRYVNFNLELSARLKEVPIQERCYYAVDFIDHIVSNNPGEFLVLDNIEILFSKHLQIEPLSVLENTSKYHKVIAAWPGYIMDGYLTYAEAWHGDYVRYSVDELECLYLEVK